MSNDIINSIKNFRKTLKRNNEENVKIQVIRPTLEILGYDPSSFDYEHPLYHRKGIADIAIEIKKDIYLYVEAKEGSTPLDLDAIIQLSNYLHIKNIEWGIISNGYELILINDKIESLIKDETSHKDKVIFHININSNFETQYIQYFRKENIFDTKVTNYFRDIAQYKSYRYSNNETSWRCYKGTLFNFFNYYAQKENKYRELKELRIDDFQNFLEHDKNMKSTTGKTVTSVSTFQNKSSHLCSMLNELKKHGKLLNHNFECPRDKIINSIDYENTLKETIYLNPKNVSIILDFLKNNKRNRLRDTTIFLFCLYIGLERSELHSLCLDMIDFKNKTIKIKNRIIPLPNKIIANINELKIMYTDLLKPAKPKSLFYCYRENQYKPLSENLLNDVFSKIIDIDINTEYWTYFSPQYIRNSLISQLFKSGYAIEEISYLTGMDLPYISKLIPYNELCKKINLSEDHPKRKHPYSKFLD